jgi:crotonobetainyl-CoA:carnitine CoA-transferase CaiB-like acyl-CoA transferase
MSDRVPPLDGILVLDFSTTRAELAGRNLFELGAEVIKIEPPGGAHARTLPPFDDAKPLDGESSLYWVAVASGKKSVVMDINDDAQRALLRPWLERADVIIESFDPGVMDALALGYKDVSRFNPRVIYASVTPYGQDGPDAQSPATELTLEAAGGLISMQGDGDRPPVPVGFPQAAFHAGAQAAADVCVALVEREHSGLGQHLDVSMQAAVVWTLMNATGYPPNVGDDPPTGGANRPRPLPSPIPGVTIPKIWECADGYLTVTLVGGRVGRGPMGSAMSWAEHDGVLPTELCGLDWSGWPLNAVSGQFPAELAQRAIDAIGECFRRHTQHELMQMGTDAGMLLAPVLPIDHVLTDPQLQSRNYWVTVDGRTQPGLPVRLSGTPLRGPERPPRLAEHQAVLSSPPAARQSPAPAPGRRSRTFEGLKIADFAWIGVGPIVSKAFADHGATVIHIESASRPDLLRTIPPFKDGIPGLDRAQFMANFNSSKLGIGLDLATEAGRAVARRLIDWSDVVTESFTSGAAERLGFGYKDLSKDRPDLLMFSTCLRGQSGPQRHYGGYGGQGAALAGIYGITGWPDRPPTGPWGAYTDFIAPRYGIAALSAAIRHRELTGQGQHIDLAQVEAGIHFIEPLILDYTVNGRVFRAPGHESPYASPAGVYRCAGHERFITIACETAQQWRALCEMAPLGDFSSPAFDALEERLRYDHEIDSVLEAWCADADAFDLSAALKMAGVPASVVLRPSDLYHDAQLKHRDFFKLLDHSVMGPTPYDGPVTLFSETPPAYTAAPCLGEHTEYVLTEILGLTGKEIAEYAGAGAFT